MRVAVTGSAGPAIGTRVVDTLAGLRPLAPFFCLYVTFGATLGFLSGGAPLILRARGVELAEVGLLQLINLPVGLTFLWAPLLDRLRLPFLSHRIGWIAAAQAASVLLLATATTDLTHGIDIAATQQSPPYMYQLLFLIGFVGGTLFRVTTMTVSAAITLVLIGATYTAATGSYYFIDTSIPAAVFLGLSLLFTDPSTSPRTDLGRVIFGTL